MVNRRFNDDISHVYGEESRIKIHRHLKGFNSDLRPIRHLIRSSPCFDREKSLFIVFFSWVEFNTSILDSEETI